MGFWDNEPSPEDFWTPQAPVVPQINQATGFGDVFRQNPNQPMGKPGNPVAGAFGAIGQPILKPLGSAVENVLGNGTAGDVNMQTPNGAVQQPQFSGQDQSLRDQAIGAVQARLLFSPAGLGRGLMADGATAEGAGALPQIINQGSRFGNAQAGSGALDALTSANTQDQKPLDVLKNVATNAASGYVGGFGLGAADKGVRLGLSDAFNSASPALRNGLEAIRNSPANNERDSVPIDPTQAGTELPKSEEKPNVAKSTLDDTEFNPDKYVKEQTKLQEQARAGEKGNIRQRLNDQIAELKTKVVDNLSPIEDIMHQAQKDGADIKPENNITYQFDRALRTDTLAPRYAEDNGLTNIIRSVPDTKAFDQYLIAKRALSVEDRGIETGRDLNKDQALVNALRDKYEPYAEQIKTYSDGLLDKASEYGLISKDLAEKLKKDESYAPLQRIFSEDETLANQGTGRGIASVGSQKAVQKLEGSKRQVESPLASFLAKTQDIIDQGERNKAASILASYKDLPGNPFDITPLRTAENVKARIDIYSQVKELRPIQNKLERLIQTRGNWSRALTREIDNLNKQGLNLSLRKPYPENPNLNAVTTKVTQRIKNGEVVRTGVSDNAKNAGYQKNFRTILNNLVNEPRSEIEAIKSKIATRENKLGPILDKIADMSDQVNAIKLERKSLLDEGKLHADANARGKATFNVMNDGIKEVYEADKSVVEAAKSLNKEQLGLIGKILSYPTRILRLGATGINPAFAAANIVKDTGSAFINSKHPIRTSIANPDVFLQALKASFGHIEGIGETKEHAELVRNAAGGTSFDIARDQPVETVNRVRASRNPITQLAYTVRHPSELLRAVEDTIGRSEEMGRAVQYFGNKKAYLKEGKDEATAQLMGAGDARTNTTNFARGGDYAKVLNTVLPYLNAGIQGSRTLMRNVKDRPLQTGAKIALIGFIPMAGATAWNLSDPERKKAYDNIPDFEKQNNIIVIPPHPTQDAAGKWNIIKIPVSQEIANLLDPVRNGIEAMQKDKAFDFTQVATSLLGTATSLNVNSPRQLTNQLLPQATKPAVEGLTNQNLFTGQPVVPDYIKQAAGGVPAEEYKKTTSGTAMEIGKALGISPLHIENFVSTVAGGVGSNLLNASDQIQKAMGNDIQVGGKDVIASSVGRFNKASGTLPAVQQFQANQNIVNQAHLSQQELNTYNGDLHPTTKDPRTGVPLQKDDNSFFTTPEKALIYLKNPSLFALDQKIVQSNPDQPHDAIFNQTPELAQAILLERAGKALPGQTYTKGGYSLNDALGLSNNPDYQNYQAQQSQYIAALQLKNPNYSPQTSTNNIAGISQQNNVIRPTASAYVQSMLNAGNFKDPQVQQYLNQSAAFTNQERGNIGLKTIAGYGQNPAIGQLAYSKASAQGGSGYSAARNRAISKSMQANNRTVSKALKNANRNGKFALKSSQKRTRNAVASSSHKPRGFKLA